MQDFNYEAFKVVVDDSGDFMDRTDPDWPLKNSVQVHVDGSTVPLHFSIAKRATKLLQPRVTFTKLGGSLFLLAKPA